MPHSELTVARNPKMKELLLFWTQTVNNLSWEGGQLTGWGGGGLAWEGGSAEMDVQEEKSWGWEQREVGGG